MSVFTTPAAVVERDRFGRPLITPLRGTKPEPYTRATTLAGAVDDKSGLILWKQRLTALGLSANRDLLTAVATTDPSDKKTLNRLVDEAAERAGATAAATTGTALHTFTERIDTGQPVGDVPPEHEADLAAYRDLSTRAGWKVEAAEIFLVCHSYRVAGTADRILTIDGKSYIADVKTGSSLAFPHSFAAQLAIYANSLPYDVERGTTVPWGMDGMPPKPETDRGLIIHMPAGKGTASAHWIDLQAGWEAAKLAYHVRQWRSRRDLLTDFTPGSTDPLVALINTAPTVDDLNDLWSKNQKTWADHHTAAAAARKASLTATAV